MSLLLIGFTLYFCVVAIIALVSYWYNRSSQAGSYDQVMMGNRSVNYILTALSAHASDMSEWLFMAFPAFLYTGGLYNAWIAIGLITGMWVAWQYVAPALRRKTEELNAYTLSTFFDRRFKDSTGFLRVASAFISAFFFAVYIAAGLKGFGMLTESLFGIPYAAGTLLATLCMIFYIIFGGFQVLAWIDAFQAVFLLVGICIVPIVGFQHGGGWHAIIQAAAIKGVPLTLIPATFIDFVNVVLLAASWGVGYFSLPHLLTKFMGISEPKELRKSKYIGLTWQCTVFLAAGLVGLLGLVYFPETLKPELIFIDMVKLLFSSLTIGLILSAIAGAILSVVTAQMLVLISVITEDFYRALVRPRASERELLWVYRASILVVAFASLLISLDKTSNIRTLVGYAWMGFGCAYGPLVLLSLHSKTITKQGAYACLIVGMLVSVVWPIVSIPLWGVVVPTSVAGFALSTLSAYGVSWFTRNNKKLSSQ